MKCAIVLKRLLLLSFSCNIQLKVIAVDDGLEVYTELAVEYDSDLKEYK